MDAINPIEALRHWILDNTTEGYPLEYLKMIEDDIENEENSNCEIIEKLEEKVKRLKEQISELQNENEGLHEELDEIIIKKYS